MFIYIVVHIAYFVKSFDEIFAPEKDLELEFRGLDFFKLLVLQTLFRPRDLIKLLKTLTHNK